MGEGKKTPWWDLWGHIQKLDPPEGTDPKDLGDIGKMGERIGRELRDNPKKPPPFN